MPFFEPLPPWEEEAPQIQPAGPVWIASYQASRDVIAKSDQAALVVWDVAPDPFGFEFVLRTYFRFVPHRMMPPGMDVTSRELRVGISFSDGRRAEVLPMHPHFGSTAIAAFATVDEPALGQPPALAITRTGGHGGMGIQDWTHRVNQLPPAGAVRLVVEWLTMGIVECSVEIDGSALRSAGGHATQLWSDTAS